MVRRYARLMAQYKGYMERVRSVVLDAFNTKLKAAMDVIKKAACALP